MLGKKETVKIRFKQKLAEETAKEVVLAIKLIGNNRRYFQERVLKDRKADTRSE